MTKILFVDCDGTIREPSSGAKFIQNPHDQKIIKGADEAIKLELESFLHWQTSSEHLKMNQ